jgi:hypothetical protein
MKSIISTIINRLEESRPKKSGNFSRGLGGKAQSWQVVSARAMCPFACGSRISILKGEGGNG